MFPYPDPSFSENFTRNDYFCRGVLQEKRRFFEVGGVFGGWPKGTLRLYSRPEKGNE